MRGTHRAIRLQREAGLAAHALRGQGGVARGAVVHRQLALALAHALLVDQDIVGVARCALRVAPHHARRAVVGQALHALRRGGRRGRRRHERIARRGGGRGWQWQRLAAPCAAATGKPAALPGTHKAADGGEAGHAGGALRGVGGAAGRAEACVVKHGREAGLGGLQTVAACQVEEGRAAGALGGAGHVAAGAAGVGVLARQVGLALQDGRGRSMACVKGMRACRPGGSAACSARATPALPRPARAAQAHRVGGGVEERAAGAAGAQRGVGVVAFRAARDGGLAKVV